MRALLAPDIIRMWEAGRDQAPLDRALTLLFSADAAEASRDELAALSIGCRDARLLELRRRVFGEVLQAFAECPQCGSYLEMQFAAQDIETNGEKLPAIHELASDGVAVRFRSPTSADLAKAMAVGDVGAAREALVGQCLIEARNEGTEISVQELSPEVAEEISRRMAAADPGAEVLLDLRCPVCAHSWEALFDIASFFWKEISANARRLLREVDALARAYGWGETEILGLSAPRRQAYLELIGA